MLSYQRLGIFLFWNSCLYATWHTKTSTWTGKHPTGRRTNLVIFCVGGRLIRLNVCPIAEFVSWTMGPRDKIEGFPSPVCPLTESLSLNQSRCSIRRRRVVLQFSERWRSPPRQSVRKYPRTGWSPWSGRLDKNPFSLWNTLPSTFKVFWSHSLG